MTEFSNRDLMDAILLALSETPAASAATVATLQTLVTNLQNQVNNLSQLTTGFNINNFGSIFTTDNTETLLTSINIPVNKMGFIKFYCQVGRLGGISGTEGDCASFEKTLRVVNTSGTLEIRDIQSDFTSQDQAWQILFNINGNNINISGIGSNQNNLQWVGTTWVQLNSI